MAPRQSRPASAPLPHAWRPVVVAVMAGMSLLGAYTVSTQHFNGMGAAMEKYIVPATSPSWRPSSSSSPSPAGGSDPVVPGKATTVAAAASAEALGYPGAPKPLTTQFTGNLTIDLVLTYLIGYFSGLLDGEVGLEHRLYAVWAFMQFGGCCAVMLLEGQRKGTKGWRAGAFTTTFTVLVQVMSYMFMQPLWTIAHLLTSDVAGLAGPVTISTLSVEDNLWELVVFPLTVTLTYICTIIPVFLPSPGVLTATQHYGWIAAWQPFPIYHFVVQWFLSRVVRVALGPLRLRNKQTGQPLSASRAYLTCVRWVYNFIAAMGIVAQVPVLALVLLPRSAWGPIRDIVPLPASLEAYLGNRSGASLSLWSIFAPYQPWNYPTVDAENLKSGELAPLAVHFLHYDMYLGCGSLLIWALYLYKTTAITGGGVSSGKRRPGQAPAMSLPGVAARAAGWFCIGGFPAAIATVLWHRDVAIHTLDGGGAQGGVKEKL
ncbi:hypothetical protein Micbo1qcDRAFT_230370 [Microdochium bolleyi]|uniref:Uncharacterized protein n=1 Tax=Microdochium bolleyi TaxID=196109 RepID=A0A136JCZ2_9PEZI|nr:hypothetical protein Micbo1qcDRAFT_230370 [Microdochium bolleyi]